MASINYYLAGTAGYAEAARAVLRELLMQPGLRQNAYAVRSLEVIEEMLTNLNRALETAHLNNPGPKLKSYLEAIYNCGSMLIELNTMLNRTADISWYGEKLRQLKAYMDSIKNILSDAAHEVVRLFGINEAMFIVNPTFQGLSGIWDQYWKALKSEQGQAVSG